MRRLFSIGLIAQLVTTSAQMPDTDIWLFNIHTDKLQHHTLADPLNITNRKGYDNQPAFTANNQKIYYSSVHDDGQADVYVYDLKKKKTLRHTTSVESEYSPTLSPDSRYLVSVVVEKDSAQRIHFLDPLTGAFMRKLDFDSVGYFTFLNTDTLVYYKLTAPHSLRYHVLSTGEDKFLAASVTRGFKTKNRHTLLFGVKDSASVTVYQYDFHLHKATKLTGYPTTHEDLVWNATLGLIRSDGDKLLRFDEQKKEWIPLFDLAPFGIKKITRFVFDAGNKRLAVVYNL